MRRVLAPIVGLVAALTLAGCMQPSDPDWMPRGWNAQDLRVVEEAPSPLSAGDVPGLAGERVRNDTLGVQARVAVVPGAPAVSTAAMERLRAAIDAREASTGLAMRPEVLAREAGLAERRCVAGSTLRPAGDVIADPALGPVGGTGTAVVCDILAATASVIGQRIRTIDAVGGAPTADRAEVFFADVASGEIVGARGLWGVEAAASLWGEVSDMLRREAGSLSLAPVDPPDAAAVEAFAGILDTTVPATDGSFVFRLPAGFTSPALDALGAAAPSAERLIAVPPARVVVLASPLGVTLSNALAAGAAFRAPDAPPTRTGTTDCRLAACVALTFDDGPGPLTPGILDALAAERSAATFYAIGRNVAGGADTLRRMVAEGNELANHTWNHPQLPTLDEAAIGRQIRDTQNAIRDATGVTPTTFRPPYGEYDDKVLKAAGLPAILWDVDTNDWQQPDPEVLVARAVDRAQPRSIVLMHDVHELTARVTPEVIRGLRDRGFTLVTVTELFGGTAPPSGAWRSAR
ncbi:MAG: hypothetical protein K0S70_4589 [Microbacterium sp.]|nr:hypothetical protein [Microbacterium sp.]